MSELDLGDVKCIVMSIFTDKKTMEKHVVLKRLDNNKFTILTSGELNLWGVKIDSLRAN